MNDDDGVGKGRGGRSIVSLFKSDRETERDAAWVLAMLSLKFKTGCFWSARDGRETACRRCPVAACPQKT